MVLHSDLHNVIASLAKFVSGSSNELRTNLSKSLIQFICYAFKNRLRMCTVCVLSSDTTNSNLRFFQFCTFYVFRSNYMGTKQIKQFMLLTLHCINGLVSQQLCKTAILYAYKAHRHKTCFIKLSHAKYASEEK